MSKSKVQRKSKAQMTKFSRKQHRFDIETFWHSFGI